MNSSDIDRNSTEALAEREFEFHKQEHQLLRHEIDSLGEENVKLQILALTGLGLFFFFFQDLANKFSDKPIKILIYIVPIIIVLVAHRKCMNNLQFINDSIVPYIMKIEEKYSNNEVGGWEVFIKKKRGIKSWKRSDFASAASLFWLYLYLVCIIVALYLCIREISA